jgi:Na+-transporting methylmalonyl-CoA/oxaloacetate decarboxylase gamma subunit
MAQVERIAYGLALTTFGVVFVFLITLTILAK